ncbi:hypothetical protein Q1695_002587 [Nippostrongylus brasiliensis]|nr:hypothetical protein Q1695_002587 [Nippostrongylus brasiliensis]
MCLLCAYVVRSLCSQWPFSIFARGASKRTPSATSSDVQLTSISWKPSKLWILSAFELRFASALVPRTTCYSPLVFPPTAFDRRFA